MHEAAERVSDALRAAGVSCEVRELAASTRTAAEAAEALGCEIGAIANSLVFVVDGEPVLVLASGAHRVDTGLVAAGLGGSGCRRATPEEVRAATGQPIGGVSPVGHPGGLRSLIDTDLRRYATIWAAAGTPYAVFPTSFDELRVVAGAVEAVVA